MLAHFAEFQKTNPDESLAEFVRQHALSALPVLSALVMEDMRFRSARGESVPVTDYFQWFPDLRRDDAMVRKVLSGDFREQFAAGRCHDISEYSSGDSRLDQVFKNAADANCLPFRDADRPPPGRVATRRRQSLVGCTFRNYRIDEILAAGRRSTVYKAVDQNLERLVVLKVSDHPDQTAGREARFLARLEHANILPIHDEFEADGRLFIVTQYVAGDSLAGLTSRWHDGTPLDNARIESRFGCLTGRARTRAAVGIIRDVVSAVRHAHNQGVLHCDIKPGNILIESTGIPRLMDFDIALYADSADESLGGTIGYMSPEQGNFFVNRNAENRRVIDHRSDLFSLGVVFFELLTGELPKWDSTRDELAAALGETPGCTRSLRSLICKCLAPLPDNRYQSAGELVFDIQAWLDDRPLRYAPDTWLPERAWRLARRHPVVVSLTTAVALLLLAGLLRSRFEIHTVERSMTRLEEQLESASARDIPALAGTLLQTRAAINGTPPWNWFFSGKRQHAADRLQIILWKVARREGELLTGYAMAGSPGSGIPMESSQESPQDLPLEGESARESGLRQVLATGESSANRSFTREFVEFRERGWIELLREPDAFTEDEVERFMQLVFPSLTAKQRAIVLSPAPSLEGLLAKLEIDPETVDEDSPTGSAETGLQDIEWHLLGVGFHLSGNIRAAGPCFQRAVDTRLQRDQIPWIHSIRHLLNYFLDLQDYQNANRYLEMAIALEANQDEYWSRLGLVREKLGWRAEAIRCLRSAIEISPDTADYHADLGALYIRDEQVDLARKYLNEAVRLGSQRQDVALNRAIATYLSGDVETAIRQLSALVRAAPGFHAAAELLEELETRNPD